MSRADLIRSRFAALRADMVGDSLSGAIGRTRRYYGGAGFESVMGRFYADPAGADGEAFLAWLDELRQVAEAIQAKVR